MKKCKGCGKEINVHLGNYVNYYIPVDLSNPNASVIEGFHLSCFLHLFAEKEGSVHGP